jgi:hypothetical protein
MLQYGCSVPWMHFEFAKRHVERDGQLYPCTSMLPSTVGGAVEGAGSFDGGGGSVASTLQPVRLAKISAKVNVKKDVVFIEGSSCLVGRSAPLVGASLRSGGTMSKSL